MKEKYSASEIIFGTRKEYEDLQKKFRLLRILTDISNAKDANNILYRAKVDDNTYRNGIIVPNILYSLTQSPNTLNGLIRYLKSYLYGMPKPACEEGRIIKDDNNNYSTNSEVISIKNQEGYNEIVNEILNLDFLNKMNFYVLWGIKGYPTLIDQTPNSIRVKNGVSDIERNKKYLGEMIYHPEDSSLTVQAYRKYYRWFPIGKESVQELLDTEVSAERLSDYQKSIIDSSPSIDKEIIIDDGNDKFPKFYIEEFDDYIHLVRKKSI